MEFIKIGDFTYLFDGQKKTVEPKVYNNIFFSAYTNVIVDTEFNPSVSKYLVIMDGNLKQLKNPFPYYLSTRKRDFPSVLATDKEDGDMSLFDAEVYLLNENLIDYYERVKRKLRRKRMKEKLRN